jgi:hypothetical protein
MRYRTGTGYQISLITLTFKSGTTLAYKSRGKNFNNNDKDFVFTITGVGNSSAG